MTFFLQTYIVLNIPLTNLAKIRLETWAQHKNLSIGFLLFFLININAIKKKSLGKQYSENID